jgi:outer membrane protein assembly factor BamD (BamD/ComL family)
VQAPPSSEVPPKPEARGGSLLSERAILDRARKNLLSGEPSAALEDVERHAKRYPRGDLAEEREALRVEALVAAERYDEARLAAARFRATYPWSMLGAAVKGAVQTIP